jgi:hypothetical protein
MKLEEAEAGRWIEHVGDRLKIVYVNQSTGRACLECKNGRLWIFSNFDGCELLPPECDSFDWQPETFPQYWTAKNCDVAFNRRDSADKTVRVMKDGREYRWAYSWEERIPSDYTQLTEAEALALLDKPEPVESPDDWVVQDRVPVRIGIDEFAWFWHDKQSLGPWRIASSAWAWDSYHRHGQNGVNATLHLRCRRKDLPPLPEPVKPEIDPGEGYQLLGDDEVTLPADEREYAEDYTNEWVELGKLFPNTCEGRTVKYWGNVTSPDIVIRRKVEPVKPATRKVVLTEWLVETKYSDHSEFRVCLSTSKPIGAWNIPIAIGTREIEVPL